MDQCQGDWKSCDQQTMEELSILGSILLKTVFLHLAYKTMVLLHSLTQSTVFNMSSELFYLKSHWKTFVSWTSVHAVWFFVSSDPLDECIFAKEHISNFFLRKCNVFICLAIDTLKHMAFWKRKMHLGTIPRIFDSPLTIMTLTKTLFEQ